MLRNYTFVSHVCFRMDWIRAVVFDSYGRKVTNFVNSELYKNNPKNSFKLWMVLLPKSMQIFFLRSWGNMICGCITVEKYFWQHSHKLEEMYAWVIYTGQFSRKSNFPLTRCILLLSFISTALTPLEKQKLICNRPEKCKETSARDSKPKFDLCFYIEGQNSGTNSDRLISEEKTGLGGRSLGVRASLIAQLVKSPPAMQETLVRFLSQEDLLEKG